MPMPAARPPDATHALPTADGLTLAVSWFAARGTERAAVVFVHGFSAHAGLFMHVAAGLADAGLAATIFDCRGHGRSQGKRGDVKRFADFTDDLARVCAWARERSPGKMLAVVAHSHGATVTLAMVLGGGPAPERLVLLCPFLGVGMPVPAWKMKLANLMERIWPSLGFGNELASENATRDPEVAAALDADPLVHHVASPRWFNETRRAQAHIREHAAELAVPTLMLLAGDERVVDNRLSTAFFESCRAAGRPIALRIYPELRHEVFLEPERERVIADVAAWIGENVPV